MTMRWKPGKKPTKKEIVFVISNALPKPVSMSDADAIADAIIRFLNDRLEGKT